MSTATETTKIDAKLVKELREKSGAPMGDCLKALQETKGNMEDAFVVLRKRGMASAAKKASRSTNEGAVGTYIHAGGKIGVLLELNCESDFVARTEDFQSLLRDIAMHIAATDPRYVRKEDVTEADPGVYGPDCRPERITGILVFPPDNTRAVFARRAGTACGNQKTPQLSLGPVIAS